MKLSCTVTQDLLPLYAEELAADETRALVEAHLEECPGCRQALEELREPRPVTALADTVPLQLMKQLLRRQTLTWCVLVACLAAAIVFAFAGRMTAAESAPYNKGVFSFGRNADGALFIAITSNARDGVDYQLEYFYDEQGRECIAVAGYTSPLLRALRVNRSGTKLVARSNTIRHVYYCDHSRGGKLTLLEGPSTSANASGGAMLLPRLVLNYYLFAALALSALFLLLWLIFRKKASGLALLHTALAFCSYALAHFAVKGLSGVTYFLQQDLAFILLTAATLFGTLWAVLALYRLQK